MIDSTRDEKPVTLRIDGRDVTAAAGTFVLQVAREAGIEIPTLCDDPALEPAGACRLCLVEVTHPDWNGWSGLMTSCLYPVAEGIEVSTASERVIEARRQVLTLLAARCPNSELIRDLAARHEVKTEGLHVDPGADDCILCGLCTRACETYATSAITTVGRGAGKAIGSFGSTPPGDCVGCGACALVCPTGNISAVRTGTDYRIWDRAFDTAVCTIDRTRCLGCGSCEEACPFAVARVTFHPDGRRVATIPREHCRGCGACVGACPSGAIDQEVHDRATLFDRVSAAKVSVLACGRADLGRSEPPESVEVTELPCTGRVSVPLLLAGLARGSEGVLVLGRHQESCRLNGAEDPVRRRVRRAREALRLVGLDAERIHFAVPDPGPGGPPRAVRDFAASVEALGASPVREPAQLLADEGLDTGLALLDWLAEHGGGASGGEAWLESRALAPASPGGPALFPGALPRVSVLAGSLLAPVRIPDVLQMALASLARVGVEGAGLRIGSLDDASAVYTLSADDARALAKAGIDATPLDELLLERGREHAGGESRPVACDGSPTAVKLIETFGHRPVDVGPDPLPERFAFSPVERLRAEERLQLAEREGATALLVLDPLALVRQALITRDGTWRSSRVLPVLAPQLFWYASSGTPLTTRALENPLHREPCAVGSES